MQLALANLQVTESVLLDWIGTVNFSRALMSHFLVNIYCVTIYKWFNKPTGLFSYGITFLYIAHLDTLHFFYGFQSCILRSSILIMTYIPFHTWVYFDALLPLLRHDIIRDATTPYINSFTNFKCIVQLCEA